MSDFPNIFAKIFRGNRKTAIVPLGGRTAVVKVAFAGDQEPVGRFS